MAENSDPTYSGKSGAAHSFTASTGVTSNGVIEQDPTVAWQTWTSDIVVSHCYFVEEGQSIWSKRRQGFQPCFEDGI